MAGRHPFSELIARMTPEERAEMEADSLRLQKEMERAEARQSLKQPKQEDGTEFRP